MPFDGVGACFKLLKMGISLFGGGHGSDNLERFLDVLSRDFQKNVEKIVKHNALQQEMHSIDRHLTAASNAMNPQVSFHLEPLDILKAARGHCIKAHTEILECWKHIKGLNYQRPSLRIIGPLAPLYIDNKWVINNVHLLNLDFTVPQLEAFDADIVRHIETLKLFGEQVVGVATLDLITSEAMLKLKLPQNEGIFGRINQYSEILDEIRSKISNLHMERHVDVRGNHNEGHAIFIGGKLQTLMYNKQVPTITRLYFKAGHRQEVTQSVYSDASREVLGSIQEAKREASDFWRQLQETLRADEASLRRLSNIRNSIPAPSRSVASKPPGRIQQRAAESSDEEEDYSPPPPRARQVKPAARVQRHVVESSDEEDYSPSPPRARQAKPAARVQRHVVEFSDEDYSPSPPRSGLRLPPVGTPTLFGGRVRQEDHDFIEVLHKCRQQ